MERGPTENAETKEPTQRDHTLAAWISFVSVVILTVGCAAALSEELEPVTFYAFVGIFAALRVLRRWVLGQSPGGFAIAVILFCAAVLAVYPATSPSEPEKVPVRGFTLSRTDADVFRFGVRDAAPSQLALWLARENLDRSFPTRAAALDAIKRALSEHQRGINPPKRPQPRPRPERRG